MNDNEVEIVDRVTEHEIRSQLERILQSSPFRSSKRHPRFLRFVIDKTLSGTAHDIKERIIGVEVFDREIHYDVSSDPIVRVAAGEIRKRLAQYYIQPGHERELRIELPPGSYIPTFYMPCGGEDTETDAKLKSGSELQPLLTSSDTLSGNDLVSPFNSETYTGGASGRKRVLIASLLLAALILALVGNFVWSRGHHRSKDLDAFWQPLLNASSGAILCIGDLNYLIKDQSPTLPSDVSRILAAHDHISGIDAVAMARIVGFMGERNRYSTVLLADNATLTDLRGRPAILIGAFNNHWTGELLSNYRFQFQHDAINQLGTIRDTHNSRQAWTIDLRSPPAAVHKDYALISRIRSSITEQTELMIAGIGPSGTVAATEFITNPRYFNEFTKLAPKGWENREIQIVITTDVIGERPAPPHVLAFDIH